MNFRRAMKMTAQNTMAAGAKGIRIQVAGRLNNAEMARREKTTEQRLFTHCALTSIYIFKNAPGIIGVKVWIYKGERSRMTCCYQRKLISKVCKVNDFCVFPTLSMMLPLAITWFQFRFNKRLPSIESARQQ